jgi:hypothetical protein
MQTARAPKLEDLPLWRLMVLLDDAERTLGADSETARTVAHIIQQKLKGQKRDSADEPEVRHG